MAIHPGPLAPPWRQHWFVRRLCTSNPFYVISAALFLLGMRASFGADARAIEIGAMMTGLAGYTLLLAATALALVRFGNVWEDVRTVLLLVVVMFLATSVTFDDLFVAQPGRAVLCEFVGLGIAVLVSEIVLRGMRLVLPLGFRGPYYLLLAVFFLYPAALSPFLDNPQAEAVQWGVFGFATTAGLAFLTLLPAIRRGADYVRDNGSPWEWPLYPWVVFGVFALAAPARAFLLCYSMHWLDRAQGAATIFDGYFLVPFGMCLAVLLLEAGLVSRNMIVKNTALLLPLALVALALAPLGHDRVASGFAAIVRQRLGGDPVFLTLALTAGFYFYAALRGVEGSLGALTGMLVAMTFLGRDFSTRGASVSLVPLTAALALQLGLGWRKRRAGHWWLAAIGALILVGRDPFKLFPTLDVFVALHAFVVTLAAGGALCNGRGARGLRLGAGATLTLISFATALIPLRDGPGPLAWAPAYPLAAGTALGCYGFLLRDRNVLVMAGFVLGGWLIRMVWQLYQSFRGLLAGAHQILASVVLFGVAVLVSLLKSGRLEGWLARWKQP
ncbi:MAG: hypothetical protein WCL32_06910 [Planctomycetota bacterium]